MVREYLTVTIRLQLMVTYTAHLGKEFPIELLILQRILFVANVYITQQNYYADTNLDGLILNSVSLSLNPSWNKFFVVWL